MSDYIGDKIASLREDFCKLDLVFPVWYKLGLAYTLITGEEVISRVPPDWEERDITIKHVVPVEREQCHIDRRELREIIIGFRERVEDIFKQTIQESHQGIVLSIIEDIIIELMFVELTTMEAEVERRLYGVT